jgi:TetR/AcrR family transcriptional regulator, regulator of mycofactocin system
MGVREDKKRDTRVRIERAALDLFASAGYDRTTVEEVAKRAGVSARTAFRYFPAKSDLMFGDADANLATLRSLLAAQDGSLSAFDAGQSALAQFSDRIGTPMNAERVRVIATSPSLTRRSLEVREHWAEAITQELADRGGRSTPVEQDRLGGWLVVSVLASAMREWSIAEQGPDDLRRAIGQSAQLAKEILQG